MLRISQEVRTYNNAIIDNALGTFSFTIRFKELVVYNMPNCRIRACRQLAFQREEINNRLTNFKTKI